MGDTTKSEATSGIVTVEELVRRHTWLSVGGLRWLLFNRATNGFGASGAIVPWGRKLFLDEARTIDWIRAGNAAKLAPARPRKAAAPVTMPPARRRKATS